MSLKIHSEDHDAMQLYIHSKIPSRKLSQVKHISKVIFSFLILFSGKVIFINDVGSWWNLF